MDKINVNQEFIETQNNLIDIMFDLSCQMNESKNYIDIEVNFETIFKKMKVDYIVRALGSDEISNKNTNKPLDLMGQLLAKKLNAQYVTNILTKEKTQQLKYAGNQYNRKNIYSWSSDRPGFQY